MQPLEQVSPGHAGCGRTVPGAVDQQLELGHRLVAIEAMAEAEDRRRPANGQCGGKVALDCDL
jgi:hypothetical protein